MTAEPALPVQNDPLQRVVAVLIIVVTLLGAVVAFLQTQAGNRESASSRAAQAAAVDATATLVEANRRSGLQAIAADVWGDEVWKGYYSFASAEKGPTGEPDPFAVAQSQAVNAAAREIQRYTSAIFGPRYVGEKNAFDIARFYEDQYESGYRVAEWRKAHERERDGWSSKGSRYITVITVYAVALFLLGLTLTVPGGARKPFLWMGSAVALAATIWGIVVWSGAVEKPSRTAIEAYARGEARLQSIDTGGTRADYERVLRDLTKAIDARDTFQEAYVARGSTHFRLDFLDERGPQGSTEARDDWRRAIELDPGDYVGWGDLGAADFWLGDYVEGLRATDRALELRPSNPIFNLNRALFLKVTDRDTEYREQVRRVREVLTGVPDWLRTASVRRYEQVWDLGTRFRPAISERLKAMREEILSEVHEIDAALRTVGKPRPAPVATKAGPLSFTLTPARDAVQVSFAYTSMKPRARWLYDTYVSGERFRNYSFGPKPWTFRTPAGGLVLTFRDNRGWTGGTKVRTEIFVEGNFVAAGDYVVP